MKELSISIDESGDFGVYDHRFPYYIITMVFHNQNDDIAPAENAKTIFRISLGFWQSMRKRDSNFKGADRYGGM